MDDASRRERVSHTMPDRIEPRKPWKTPRKCSVNDSNDTKQIVLQRETVEGLTKVYAENPTSELVVQTERTKNMMETIVLNTETPPDSALEWKASGNSSSTPTIRVPTFIVRFFSFVFLILNLLFL